MTFAQDFRHGATRIFGGAAGLARAGIVGAGVAVYPLLIGLILIVWKGFSLAGLAAAQKVTLMTIMLTIMGNLSLACMALFAIIIIALVGVVRKIGVNGPGGVGLDIQTSTATTITPKDPE